MILKVFKKKLPTKQTLKNGEAVVVELKPGQIHPNDPGGTYLYTRVGDKLIRTKAEEVAWEY
jgi:hypothetical protein